MAESKQRLEIVTPQKKVFNEDVNFVVIPGELGELGILPNHAPLMTSLKIGEVRIQMDGNTTRMAISGGFAEIVKNKVTILADTAERPEDIDFERAERAKERAEKRLADKSADIDFIRAEMALKRAINRLRMKQ
ncbi:MAG: F0F1 ATP synthase subunit epsilon [Peptococcaceae bacterium]|nr:F0F1 ATP synthase subunit epsilon [Peptococcaceae bacterium]